MFVDASSAAPPMPADLQAILHDLDLADAEARRLVAGMSDEDLNWQPDGGTAWSVAQCLDHLARASNIYAAALLAAVRGVKPNSMPRVHPMQPGWFGRLFLTYMEPPPRRKLTAPKSLVPSHKSGEEVLQAFLSAHEKIRSLVHESKELDLNRIRFKNPFIKVLRFTVGTGLLVISAHDRRHLWQASQVCRSLEAERGQASKAS